MRYPVVFEQGPDGSYSAYPPDLPGCGVVGTSLDEARKLIADAIEMHLAGLREDGAAIPPPSIVLTELIEVHDAA
jgi:predicted RNase H-like HicB family nuclease